MHFWILLLAPQPWLEGRDRGLHRCSGWSRARWRYRRCHWPSRRGAFHHGAALAGFHGADHPGPYDAGMRLCDVLGLRWSLTHGVLEENGGTHSLNRNLLARMRPRGCRDAPRTLPSVTP